MGKGKGRSGRLRWCKGEDRMVEEKMARTASMDSMMNPGRLKKKPERSKTPRVVRSFCAFDAFSSTGRKTWSALIAASVVISFENAGQELGQYLSAGRVRASTRSLTLAQGVLPSFPHVGLHLCVLEQVVESKLIAAPSVEFFTATKRSKLSSTRILTASERASMDCLRW